MKNSIQVIAIAVVLFSNVVSASGFIKKVDLINDSKMKQAKMVCYADFNLLKSETEGLNYYSKTVVDVINSDSKIIENENNFQSNSFVTYADQDLFALEMPIAKMEYTIEMQIENDLKITENEVQKSNFVSYANENLINLEIGTLKNTKLSVDEIIETNKKVMESKTTFNYSIKPSKSAIKKALKY